MRPLPRETPYSPATSQQGQWPFYGIARYYRPAPTYRTSCACPCPNKALDRKWNRYPNCAAVSKQLGHHQISAIGDISLHVTKEANAQITKYIADIIS